MSIREIVKVSTFLATVFILMNMSIPQAHAEPEASNRFNEAAVNKVSDGVQLLAGQSLAPGFSPAKVVDDGCEWEIWVADDFDEGVFKFGDSVDTDFRVYSETGRWWSKSCPGEVDERIPEGERVSTNNLLLQAIDEIKPGEPPTRTDPEGSMKVVQAPTILSIDPAYWVARSKTVTAGRVSVTATLDPYKSVWDSGEPDADDVVCSGPGKAYVDGSNWKKYDCKHIYKWAPPPGEYYTMTTSAVFEISATSNTPETLGPYSDLFIDTSEQVEVGELQALVKSS